MQLLILTHMYSTHVRIRTSAPAARNSARKAQVKSHTGTHGLCVRTSSVTSFVGFVMTPPCVSQPTCGGAPCVAQQMRKAGSVSLELDRRACFHLYEFINNSYCYSRALTSKPEALQHCTHLNYKMKGLSSCKNGSELRASHSARNTPRAPNSTAGAGLVIQHTASHRRPAARARLVCAAGVVEQEDLHLQGGGPQIVPVQHSAQQGLGSQSIHEGERSGRQDYHDTLTTPIAQTSTYFFDNTQQVRGEAGREETMASLCLH